MPTILVTGGTGTLGRPTVNSLSAAGHYVRILSRKGKTAGNSMSDSPGLSADSADITWFTGDLSTGDGVAAAVNGADVVVHLATSRGRRDIEQARHLLQAARDARTAHLILMSIVGIDEIPLSYYRHKLEIEQLVADSGVPYTIQRATQFHNLLDEIFSIRLPILLAPAVTLQPVAVEDVAARLAELVTRPPVQGRAPDIGGPERQQLPDLARAWRSARASRRPVVPLRIPGKTYRTYASGAALVDGPTYGTITFADYLEGKA
jgi:uncharacterized protein YbjT (DUF2867 family)